MPFTPSNTYRTRSPSRIEDDLQNAVATQLGEDHSLDPADPMQAIIEALTQTFAEQENVHEELARNAVGPDSGGQFLDKHLIFTGDTREAATAAEGEVNLNLSSSLSKTDFDPLFDLNDLTFIDDVGRTYALESSVTLTSSPTTTAIAKVKAQFLGSDGNIDPGRIVDFNPDSQDTREKFQDNVASFTNDQAFSQGRDTESDPVLKRRIKTQRASRNNPTIDGIIRAASRVPGVERADGDENTNQFDATQEENVYDGGGTNSEPTKLIDSAGGAGVPTKIALRIENPERRFIQHLTAELSVDNSAIATFRIEDHDEGADEPSGSLPIARLEVTDVDMEAADTTTSAKFLRGAYATDHTADTTLWSVIEITSGSAKFKGESSTSLFSAGDAKMLVDGSWENLKADDDTTVLTNVLHKVISGIPPGAKRILIDGDFDNDDAAQALFESGAAGTGWDGKDMGTAQDRGGRDKTIWFEIPVEVPVVIDITVERTDQFTGDEDDVKDTIVQYVGGDEVDGTNRSGLDFGERLTLSQITSRIVDDQDTFLGLTDVTLLRVGEKENFPTPASLTASEENNISPPKNEAFVIEDVANDIRVTFVDQ